MIDQPSARLSNRLLALLPHAELTRLMPHLCPVQLPFKQVIYHRHAPIEAIFFPTQGVMSAIASVGNGTAIEVATIGDEGMVGLSALFGNATAPNEIMVQVAGAGLRMTASELRKQAPAGSPLSEILVRYLNAYLVQVSQAVACNGLHGVRQRCCKWLLMTHDRTHVDDLPLTHEFLGVMLGVRRASVTEVLQLLQDDGLIAQKRGVITVLNRMKLETESCECYGIITDE